MTLRDLILDNFPWKLISLLLAVLVWWRVDSILEREEEQALTPAANLEETATFSVPVRVLGPARTPRGFAVVPSEVNVTLRGGSEALQRITTTNILVYVDAIFAPDVKSAKRTVVVRPPVGVRVQEIRPREVYVEPM